jgi:hypothetical protein
MSCVYEIFFSFLYLFLFYSVSFAFSYLCPDSPGPYHMKHILFVESPLKCVCARMHAGMLAYIHVCCFSGSQGVRVMSCIVTCQSPWWNAAGHFRKKHFGAWCRGEERGIKGFGGGEIVLGLITKEMKDLAALTCVALVTLDSREMQWASGFSCIPLPTFTK